MQDDETTLEAPTEAMTGSSPAAPLPHRIGPYTILERRGEGGMGIVYLAEQTEPVKRRVALKIIKHGMDSRRVIARFEAERQVLAMMDHTAIAQIHDAGMTEDGRPYFAMEFFEGGPITEYCHRTRLPLRERIALFMQVCDGVQHAHRKAVIHRDLKPSNVLVGDQDGRPIVKIIDFGVAKALAVRQAGETEYTELGAAVGTLEYMSPEQAGLSNTDVDTRSDVYSLGVMLYELLVGTLPYESKDLKSRSLDELRRLIREVDPRRPSARVTLLGDRAVETAARMRLEPKSLRRALEGDLDWITMRALEKERSRRYASPAHLAEDLGRFLRDEPVLAHAPSVSYRAWKFVRRHRVGVAAAAVMVASLAAGIVGSTVAMVRAQRAEARARVDAESQRHVVDFLKDVFKVSDPGQSRGNQVTARELLDKAAGTIETKLSGQPETQAHLATIMAEVYENLGLLPKAEALYRQALQTRTTHLGPEHEDTLASMSNLGALFLREGRYADAERLGKQALDLKTRLLGTEHVDTVASAMNLASAYVRQGRFAEAEPLYKQAITTQERILGPEHPRTLSFKHNLAHLYVQQGRFAEAESLATEVIELRRRTLGPDHPDTLLTTSNLARSYILQKRYPEAERLLTDLLALQKRVLGPEHPAVLTSMTNLALVYQGENRFADAEALERETLEILERTLGPEAPETLWSMNNLALAYQSRGRYAEAKRLHLKTLEIRKRRFGPRNPDTLTSLYNLACVAARQGHRAEAMDWLRQDVEGGDIDFESLEQDSELESLHGPAFDALVAQVRRNAAAAQVPGDTATATAR